MTDQERYNLLLQELAEVIHAKNDEIAVLKWQLSGLEAKLKEAEALKNEFERVG